VAEEQNPDQLSMASKPQSGMGKMIWILLLCAVVAGGALWYFRNEAPHPPKPPVRTETQMRLQLPAPPPQSRAVTDNATDAPATNATDTLPASQPATPPATTEATDAPDVGRVMPKVEDDSVIRLAFIEDLTRYLADAYYPANSGPAKGEHGVLSKGPKMLNMHYGVEMTGLEWSGDDLEKGRRSILRYALNPTMVDALYHLYVDRFMDSLQRAAKRMVRTVEGEERPLTRMEIKEMHHLLALRAQATAGVLRACVVMEDGMSRVEALHAATKQALAANQTFQTALLQYQEASDAKKDSKVIAKARTAMDVAGKTYQQAIIQRERTRESLANQLRKNKWVAQQSDDANIYVAQWAYRRMLDNDRIFPALMAVHDVLIDLAERLEKKAAL